MKHLFLDLEDTVITPAGMGWHTVELINQELVRDVIAKFQPDVVSLFSFAVHNKHELMGFNMFVRPMLEKSLGRNIAFTPTMDDDIIPACCRVMKLHPEKVSFQDSVDFWSKHQAFRLFIQDRFGKNWSSWKTEIEVLLLDDAVIDESWHWPELHITGKIVRV